MKKNVMMRIASILLVCVLITTCGISGTFAKYTSSVDATATARVAKWGWGTNTLTLDMFEATYGNEVAAANGTDKLIAPGTSGSAPLTWTPDANFKPEVDYVISFSVKTQEISDEIEAQLDWTLSIDGAAATEYDTFDALEAALMAKTYACEANASAPTVNIVIGWVWEFEDGSDVADTALGDAAPSLNIVITLTATQVEPNLP